MTIATTAVAVSLLAGGATWMARSTGPDPADELAAQAAAHAAASPAAGPFWSQLAGLTQYTEADPPEDVDEAVGRSDAIVVAHVTGVSEGRENRGWIDPPTPGDAMVPREKTTFVQLTVDRVIKGSVNPGDVLILDMPPVAPEHLAEVRIGGQTEKQLFFLFNRALLGKRGGYGSLVKPADDNIWNPISNRAVIGARPGGGLYLPLEGEQWSAFLASFQATTVNGAGDRAARSVR